MNTGCDIPIEIRAGCPGSARNRRAASLREPVKSAAEIERLGDEQLGDEQSTATPTPIGPKQWFCLFRGDAGPMAVPVESVAEVLERVTLVPLAWSRPQVVGMCSYHREVVPVVKSALFPMKSGKKSRASKIRRPRLMRPEQWPGTLSQLGVLS